MKKLMIAASIVCAAVFAQAASWSWQSNTTSTKGVIYDGTTSGKAYDTYGAKMVYLFAVNDYAQSQAFADIVDGKLNTSKAASSKALNSSSKIANTEFTWGTAEGNDKQFSFYAVSLFDDSTFYISDVASATQLSVGTAALTYTFNATSKTLKDAGEGWKGASVYQTVPEPTSGLLLLLGVAGLALRRRRA